jgi:hypothetical protein
LSSAAKKTASSASKSTSRLDFLHHPGMRILTKDGRDVTNSAARGSKTKEQRDHAHLMRVIKACDACRRKKTRCDPSHKKRTASLSQNQPQSQQPPLSEAKLAKKVGTNKRAAARGPRAQALDTTAHNLLDNGAVLDTPVVAYDPLSETPDDFWLQYVNFEGPAPFPEEYNFHSTFGSSSSDSASAQASPSQPLAPFTPASAAPSGLPAFLPEETGLPYLQPDGYFGTDYVDFNLYSPTSDFVEEEPQIAARPWPRTTGYPQRQSGITHERPLPDQLGISHFSTGQQQHSTAQTSPVGSILQPTLSTWSPTWSPTDVNPNGLQHAASSIYSSALPPDRRGATICTADPQVPPGQSHPSLFSHEVGAGTSISTPRDTRHLPSAARDAVVSPPLPQDQQAIALQQVMSSPGHRVTSDALSNTDIPRSRMHAVLPATSGLDGSEIRGNSYPETVTARSRHSSGALQTSSHLNQATIPESSTGQGGAPGVPQRSRMTPDALIANGTQFPALLDGATVTLTSCPPAMTMTAWEHRRLRLDGHGGEAAVSAWSNSTVLDGCAVSRADDTRPSPRQGESSSSTTALAIAGFTAISTVFDAALSSDGFKRAYALVSGLIAGAFLLAAMRFASWTGTLDMLLLSLGFYRHSSHLDGHLDGDFKSDTVPWSKTDRRGHSGRPTVALTSKLRGVARYAAGLRCAVV